MANQGHGFTWETAIKVAAFQNTQKYAYTAPFDIPAADNIFDPSENISIKVCGDDKAECADALRIFGYKDYPKITMIAVRWVQQTPTTKAIQRIYEVALGGPVINRILFGDVTEEELKALVQLMRQIPPGPVSTSAKAAVHAEKTRLNQKSGIIRFNPKMDSKSQRRLQCSIPHLSAALAAHPEMLISSSAEPLVRGSAIPATIESGPRVRNSAQPIIPP